MKSLSFFTPCGTVRVNFLRKDDIIVEACGSCFTLPYAVRSLSVSDRYVLAIDEEGALFAYDFDGDLAFLGEALGLTAPLITGSVMTASDALPLASRHAVTLAPDHAYYLATAEGYRMSLIDLFEQKIVF